MAPFELPLTVRTDAGDVRLVVDVPRETPWALALPAILSAARLPARTILHLGAGPVELDWLLGMPPLLAGSVLSTTPTDRVAVRAPLMVCAVGGPDAGRAAAIGSSPIVVGRDSAAGLCLDDPELSRRHAMISPAAGAVRIRDLGSTNGVRIDGQPDRLGSVGTDAGPGALIRLGGSLLRVDLCVDTAALLTPDGAGHLAVTRPARVGPRWQSVLPADPGPAPERRRRPLPLLAAVLGGVGGALIAVVTGSWIFLALAGLGPLTMLATALGDRISGRRSHRLLLAEHRVAQQALAAAVDDAVLADRADAWDRYADPAVLLRRATGVGTRLWERRPAGEDYLTLTVGTGSRPARIPVPEPPQVGDVPVTVDLAGIGVLGLTGQCRPLVRWLVAQLAALHSPGDLRLVVFSDSADLASAADLPHASTRGSAGGVINDPQRAAAAVAELFGPPRPTLTTVLVLDNAHRWRQVRGMAALLATCADGGTNFYALCVGSTPQSLPAECTAVASVRDGVVQLVAREATQHAEPTGVGTDYFDGMVAALAPLSDPDLADSSLPRTTGLAELLGPMDATELRRRWAAPSGRAVLGVTAAGPLSLDIDTDGPHLLIAGTTGSGKSELLLTLVSALAVAAPPTQTSFLLVDYKGGAAFADAAALPHTAGLVTDLDPALAARALASLRAEVRSREQLLAAAALPDMMALRARDPAKAPPRLVIVVDEFATMAAELPTFLTGLVDVAQRGRSLGMHLVLATQRPAGVVSPVIKANMATRICLRVADDADSLDVIDTAAATALPRDIPGRALLRTGRGRVVAFQAATVTAPPRATVQVRRRGVPRSGPVTDAAPVAGGPPAGGTSPKQDEPASPNQLTLLAAAARAAAAGRLPTPPWLPPLPGRFAPTLTEPADVIALVDLPDEQRRRLMPLPPGSVLVTGPSRSGRSAALRAIAHAAASGGAELAVIDGPGGLADLADWPQTSTVLDLADPVLVQRLIQLLSIVTPPERTRPLLLLVDDWDCVTTAVEALDFGATVTALTQLAARGDPIGVRVAASGPALLAQHRAAQSFPTVIRLGAPDGRGEPTPGAPPGRGRSGSDELQMAWRPPGAAPQPAGCAGWRARVVVRPLPALTLVDALPCPRPTAVPWGAGGDDGTSVTVDLSGPGGALLVAGPRRSGISTALATLSTQAAAAGIPVLRTYLGTVAALPDGAGPSVTTVDLRDDPESLRAALVAHRGPLLLVVDDADEVSELPAAELLVRFLAVAGPAQHLLLGARLDRALRAHRGPIAEAATFHRGLLLQAGATDGTLLGATLPRRRPQVTPGRGHLVDADRVVPIQVATRPID